jgi:hypothetical protein
MGRPLDESSHLLAIPTKLEQQLTDVRLRLYEDQQNGFRREHRYHDQTLRMLEDAGDERAAVAGGTEFVGRGNDRWDVGREAFTVEIRHGLAIDQEPISTEDDRGFDAIALSNGGDEVAYRRHAPAPYEKSCEA